MEPDFQHIPFSIILSSRPCKYCLCKLPQKLTHSIATANRKEFKVNTMLLWKVSVRAAMTALAKRVQRPLSTHMLRTRLRTKPRKTPGSQRYRIRDDTLLSCDPLGLTPHCAARSTMVVTSQPHATLPPPLRPIPRAQWPALHAAHRVLIDTLSVQLQLALTTRGAGLRLEPRF